MELSRDIRAKAVPGPWLAPIVSWRGAMAAAGMSAQTIGLRTAQISRLARVFPAGPAIDPQALLQWAATQEWKTETRRSHYAAIRRFYRHLLDTGAVDQSPAVILPRVRPAVAVARPAPEIIYRTALLDAEPRTRLILRLAGELGLRRGEIVRIHARDLTDDLLGPALLVHGKGDRPRIVPLPHDLAGELQAATERGGGYAFPGNDGGHMSAKWAGKLAARVLPGDWTLHTLRHRFATRAYNAERDLFAVQSLLGHRSPETTRRYVASDSATLRRAMAAAG